MANRLQYFFLLTVHYPTFRATPSSGLVLPTSWPPGRLEPILCKRQQHTKAKNTTMSDAQSSRLTCGGLCLLVLVHPLSVHTCNMVFPFCATNDYRLTVKWLASLLRVQVSSGLPPSPPPIFRGHLFVRHTERVKRTAVCSRYTFLPHPAPCATRLSAYLPGLSIPDRNPHPRLQCSTQTHLAVPVFFCWAWGMFEIFRAPGAHPLCSIRHKGLVLPPRDPAPVTLSLFLFLGAQSPLRPCATGRQRENTKTVAKRRGTFGSGRGHVSRSLYGSSGSDGNSGQSPVRGFHVSLRFTPRGSKLDLEIKKLLGFSVSLRFSPWIGRRSWDRGHRGRIWYKFSRWVCC